MNVFVAGATGTIGRQLIPRLVAAGHLVHAMTRSRSKQAMIKGWGATPVVADALDADDMTRVIGRTRRDVIVHELTSIGPIDSRHMAQSFAATNALRTVGTDNLLSAGRAAGVHRFVAQSHIMPYARSGSAPKDEQDAFDPAPVAGMRENQAAIEHLERAVLGATWTVGIVLRYGWFYGPNTTMAPGSELFDSIRARKFPVIGDGAGVWSFIHVADAADATVKAIERGRRGIYNVVDDDPSPVRDWLPELARQLGARPPWHVPRWVGRIFSGQAGVAMMDDIRGASNAKAKRELAWQPEHSSWRRGLTGT